MDLRRELLLGIFVVLAALLLVSFGGVILLSRMTPAIERILRENDYSIEATEEMLVVLAHSETSTKTLAGREARFHAALRRALENVTEPEETAVLQSIQAGSSGALAGDPRSRQTVVNALASLATINRRAMHATDEQAQHLGRAGAWAVVLVASFGFAAALVAFARLRRRILEPLQELVRTVRAFEEGERTRRAFSDRSAPEDLTLLIRAVNQLLDSACVSRSDQGPEHHEAIRAALIALMDQSRDRLWLTDAGGGIVVANQTGLDALIGEGGAELRKRLSNAESEAVAIGDRGHRLHREARPSDANELSEASP